MRGAVIALATRQQTQLTATRDALAKFRSVPDDPCGDEIPGFLGGVTPDAFCCRSPFPQPVGAAPYTCL